MNDEVGTSLVGLTSLAEILDAIESQGGRIECFNWGYRVWNPTETPVLDIIVYPLVYKSCEDIEAIVLEADIMLEDADA